MTKERPIIMQADSVRTTLAGRKTMTRRVIKPQPDESVTALVPRRTRAGNVLWGNALWKTKRYGTLIELQPRKCPYGQEGDRLWVKETWMLGDTLQAWDIPEAIAAHNESALYRADVNGEDTTGWGWKSPLFMPRWASRLTLEIVNVKVERLFDITEEDAKAEGVSIDATGTLTYRGAFAITWEAINGKRGYGWENGSNPFVWCIEFRKVE